MRKSDIDELKKHVIETALPSVIFDGWTMNLMQQTLEGLGRDPALAHALFPAGLVDVMRAYSHLADDKMLEALSAINPNDLRVRERVEIATQKRFHWLLQNREAFVDSFKIMALPTRKMAVSKMIWQTADVIWLWAGDESKDYNHYTKRTLLCTVLTRAALHAVARNDISARDLDRNISSKIKSISNFGQYIARLKGVLA